MYKGNYLRFIPFRCLYFGFSSYNRLSGYSSKFDAFFVEVLDFRFWQHLTIDNKVQPMTCFIYLLLNHP